MLTHQMANENIVARRGGRGGRRRVSDNDPRMCLPGDRISGIVLG